MRRLEGKPVADLELMQPLLKLLMFSVEAIRYHSSKGKLPPYPLLDQLQGDLRFGAQLRVRLPTLEVVGWGVRLDRQRGVDRLICP